ncbi:MAG: hypothetical protein AAB316_05675, partial [Bacteroidota bacterium]
MAIATEIWLAISPTVHFNQTWYCDAFRRFFLSFALIVAQRCHLKKNFIFFQMTSPAHRQTF